MGSILFFQYINICHVLYNERKNQKNGKLLESKKSGLFLMGPRCSTLMILYSMVITIATSVPHAVRYAAFDDFKTGVRLVGSQINTTDAVSAIQCSAFCNRLPECLSFNFCRQGICELNFADIGGGDLGDPKFKMKPTRNP